MVEFSDEHYFALKEDSIQLVKKLTGAKSAVAYASVYRGDNSLDSLKPVPVIHSDMSAKGADLTKGLAQDIFLKSDDPKEVEFGKHLKLGGKNVVIYNVWRPIRTVQDNPLGICKWNSVLEEDALDLGIIPTDVTNAPQPWKYRKGQRWFYLNKQRPDQVYVFMQHDSRAGKDGHGMNVPHASFSLRGDFSKKPTRMSFESVVFAIVDPIPPEGIFSRWAKDIKSLWNE
ncbi:uncharacterized protein MELLADRAFT_106271 [Melampsora larici-populina 98AG31]|uniref:Uncharacterized protein n=1 Tax=Melampsora larici-populina (strain 98AG31 / pathotype 3-4-7) TaxID=747676 RepID=F4RKU5_MELLP|nr:uncharacterized protein MELLADRAFT_106271 [Melampsora larici-populina 98AG31]EGG06786.1 hypothetical protein MELLADRAFT_106271 [Melampsora larici-populina 98AG31]